MGFFTVHQSRGEGWKSTNFECTHLCVIVYVRRNIFLQIFSYNSILEFSRRKILSVVAFLQILFIRIALRRTRCLTIFAQKPT